MKILTLSDYLKKTFGTKVYKLSLSAGCTCPNRDGTLGYGGCAFCSEGGSGDFAQELEDIKTQIQKAKKRVDDKFPRKINASDRKYIAYFQSFTNTYGDLNRLSDIFFKAINENEITALSIGTRPDCLGEDVIYLLQKLNRIKPVWVELGFQTSNEKTASSMNRGYSNEVFFDAYRRLKTAGLTVIVHVILGLPGDTEEDMLETVRCLSSLEPALDGIKLQLLHVLEGTALGNRYKNEPFHLMEMEEYCALVVKCLKLLPESTVVHRMTGDGPKKILIGPLWSGDKKRVLNLLNKMILEATRT